MMVSSKGRYALVVMTDIGIHQSEKMVPLSDIAKRSNLSLKYLESIVSVLVKGEMLRSCRGKNGGYKLTKLPSEYRISEILKLIEGSLASVECLKKEKAGCDNRDKCITLPIWIGLDKVIYDYLSNITLEDLIEDELRMFNPID